MNIGDTGRVKRVRFYVNETDSTESTPVWVWIVEFLRSRNASGASAIQPVMGFGSSGHIHTTHIVDSAIDLPVIVEWIDDESRVNELLPQITSVMTPGLVTVEDTTVVLHAPPPVRDISSDLTVATIMTKTPTSVEVFTPASEIVRCMRTHGLRAVPVVQSGVAVGIITDDDLLTHAGIRESLSLLTDIQTADVDRQLERLRPLVARDLMNSPPVTIPAKATLNRAASVMVHQKRKRLLVVDERELLVGIVSRADLLRSVAQAPGHTDSTAPRTSSNGTITLERVILRDVPTISRKTRIAIVLQTSISTQLNLAIVVDELNHVVGAVTDAELLQRLTPDLRESATSMLLNRLAVFHAVPQNVELQKRVHASTASELMTTHIVEVKATQRLNDLIETVLGDAHDIVAVTDEQDRFLGVIDRADVLGRLLRL